MSAANDPGGAYRIRQERLAREAAEQASKGNAPYVYVKKSVKNKILGIQSPSLISSDNNNYGFTLDKFDTTTYHDRALLQLHNATAGNLVMKDLSIRGKLVVQIGGTSGYVWEYSDYESIEKNGEMSSEISNDYILGPNQAADIGDNAWKILKAHDVYTLVLQGCQYQLDIGDFYTLVVDYTLPGQTSQIESINVDVEILDLTFDRTPLTLGQTIVTCRKKIGAWNKSISKRASLVLSARPQRLTNRGNIITVASKSFIGAADYYCDGTSDNVQIQAAIDYLNSIGGGEVRLTNGEYTLATTVTLNNNIKLIGEGSGSIIKYAFTYSLPLIDLNGSSNCRISDICIDGENTSRSAPGVISSYTPSVGTIIERVEIKNIFRATGASASSIWGIFVDGGIINNCYIHDFVNQVTNADAYGISSSSRCYGNIVKTITATGGGTSVGYGFYSCKKCQQNSATSCTTGGYFLSYADSGTSYACADTANGGFNS